MNEGWGDVPCEHSPPRLLVIGRASCLVQVLLQAPSSRRHLAQPRQVPLPRRRNAPRPLFCEPARPILRGPGRSLVCTRLVPILGSVRSVVNVWEYAHLSATFSSAKLTPLLVPQVQVAPDDSLIQFRSRDVPHAG